MAIARWRPTISTPGEKLWYLSGGGDIPVPTPLFAQGLVLLTNGHGRSPFYAISPSARGDITPVERGSRTADEPEDGRVPSG